MPSPFPGMDPYLEARWSDVHSKLIAYIGEALQPGLLPDLRARSDERVLLEQVDGDNVPAKRYRPHVALIEVKRPKPFAGSTGSATAIADPELDVVAEGEAESILIERHNGPQVDRSV